MSTKLAESIGASILATEPAWIDTDHLEIIAAFKAAALVDLCKLDDQSVSPFRRLARAIDIKAPGHEPHEVRFHRAVRNATIEQLGEGRAGHWHDLRLTRRASALFPIFRKSLGGGYLKETA
ncbi:hypothetical protein ABC955_10345 [Citromicrobium bathyomarinum]|uniref:hypothetical protein n=1 Tax=Erythrobacter sp. YJ-T3-07 TaxID=2793063 RepID=UPI0018D2ABCB|nr:hypothetical protein [Erythrobacter sp. YJ-T3-07]MBH1944417.1 hypothetical protein [Erythrobacter sp. YJ-T3-07]